MESETKAESGQRTDMSSKTTPQIDSVGRLKRLLEKINSLPNPKREALYKRVLEKLSQKWQSDTKASEPSE